MKYFISILILLQGMNSKIIFDFNKDANIQDWNVIDDVVMGGRSTSQFKHNSDGFGVFEGHVSLANNGGFSSVQYQFEKTKVTKYAKIKIRLKGDGKDYQFRVKNNSTDYYSYITTFSTTNEWQNVEITLKDMYPSFRGRRLNTPNFSHDYIEQIVFLIGNKKDENFKLIIDTIELI
ncbi:CIA30 family protein [Sabulilitoribacter multivorans]|uniref:CIA30 family protein n=1 Tax=Flaviramulus multivorans TaxID=1304750 RepID=A0ABS9IFV8_9FLAO|nr:CIA30 family protein [Flaviramulus multivorans]MCF7559295.1 CIA30 family protein [Flaviramulus multivorans]